MFIFFLGFILSSCLRAVSSSVRKQHTAQFVFIFVVFLKYLLCVKKNVIIVIIKINKKFVYYAPFLYPNAMIKSYSLLQIISITCHFLDIQFQLKTSRHLKTSWIVVYRGLFCFQNTYKLSNSKPGWWFLFPCCRDSMRKRNITHLRP
jgi:hypothetical protein